MSLFFKKNKGNVEPNGFSEAVEKRKLKVAEWLNRKTKGCTPLNIKIGFVVFFLIFGGISLYNLLHSFRPSGIRTHIIVLTHLHAGVPMPHSPPMSDSMRKQFMQNISPFPKK